MKNHPFHFSLFTFLFPLFIFLFPLSTLAQVSITTDGSAPGPDAMLEVKSTTKGFLPPRMTTMQRDQISSPSAGLMIFNTDCDEYQYFKGTGWTTMGNNGLIASPAALVGNTNLCSQTTGVIYWATPVPDATSYTWHVPAGATIVSGQGTSYIVVNYGAAGGSLCVTANNTCYSSLPTCISVNVQLSVTTGISISTQSTTVCQGTLVTFMTTPVNGGSAPLFQWKKNNIDIPGATNTTYSYVPENNDHISCRMISSALCPLAPAVYSNYLIMTLETIPASPAALTHLSSTYGITWNWSPVANATGYKWNTTDDYAAALDMGAATSRNETGLNCNTSYTRYVWAYNNCGNSTSGVLGQSTTACPFFCGTTALTINHSTAGGVAPVNKTTTYTTVNGIPGETSKCWITSNLGSDHQATAVNDNTEASAGWYWQFNKKKGYKHDGTTLTPAWTFYSIYEPFDWQTSYDPCSLELGTPWRIPSYSEWYNVDNSGGWTNWNGPWNSNLKLHASGYLHYSNGSLNYRGTLGYYWSSNLFGQSTGWCLSLGGSSSTITYMDKANGYCVRCIRGDQ